MFGRGRKSILDELVATKKLLEDRIAKIDDIVDPVKRIPAIVELSREIYKHDTAVQKSTEQISKTARKRFFGAFLPGAAVSVSGWVYALVQASFSTISGFQLTLLSFGMLYGGVIGSAFLGSALEKKKKREIGPLQDCITTTAQGTLKDKLQTLMNQNLKTLQSSGRLDVLVQQYSGLQKYIDAAIQYQAQVAEALMTAENMPLSTLQLIVDKKEITDRQQQKNLQRLLAVLDEQQLRDIFNKRSNIAANARKERPWKALPKGYAAPVKK